jgi:hypothetical protein
MTVRLLLAGAAAAALLTACDRAPDLPPPPADAPVVADAGLAPDTAGALPPAPPAPVSEAGPDDGQGYWDQAQEDDRYYDDRPPSYAYDYGDESPAVWIDGETVRRVVERLAGGGERYYYYRPGQDRPYFVQDPNYGYGFDDGALVTVYDVRQRRALDRQATRQRADEAGRYLARSEALRRAALQADRQQRRQLDAQQWREWRQREDRPRRTRTPAAQPSPPPVIMAPPVRDARPDRRDPPGRATPDQPPQTPVVSPLTPPDPATVKRQRDLEARTARLKREADMKARREAAAARLHPAQTPPPVAAPAPAPKPAAEVPPRTPREQARAERLKREKARAAKAAAEKAAAEKAAAEAARPQP